MERSGPATGYDFSAKRIYRKQVWRTLSDGLHDKSTMQVLILPSAEGDEIAWCETKGFRRHNIHVVDRNPAIAATLQRKFPGIQTYGVELTHAAVRIQEKPDMNFYLLWRAVFAARTLGPTVAVKEMRTPAIGAES